MAENETDKGKLPGNHGQFGEGNATEAYKPLENHPTPKPPATEAPMQTDLKNDSWRRRRPRGSPASTA